MGTDEARENTGVDGTVAGIGEAELELADNLVRSVIRFNKFCTCLANQGAKYRVDGLDKAAHILLANLVDGGPRRSGALAELVRSDPSTVSRQVAELVQAGLVERRPDPEDGRASVLAATEEGEAVAERHRRARNEKFARLLAHWPADEREGFIAHFERFVTDCENYLPLLSAEYAERQGVRGEN